MSGDERSAAPTREERVMAILPIGQGPRGARRERGVEFGIVRNVAIDGARVTQSHHHASTVFRLLRRCARSNRISDQRRSVREDLRPRRRDGARARVDHRLDRRGGP